MEKEELETAVLHSDLTDPIKLEIIRCIETAKEKETVDWNSVPHIRSREFNSIPYCESKDIGSKNDKLEITYK